MIDFRTDPSRYRHWRLLFEGEVATLVMDVDEAGGLFEGYELKLNSYDLGVDIELADAVQRLRFEHPEVKVVVLRSGKERVFCAGANIRMLAGASHAHKVNFCKFTNETRCGMEDASEVSGLKFLVAIRGSCAGGGYELALACDEIVLADDSSSSVALPEAPLLAVLPGTGGLTRLTDKRLVRRDLADVFCTVEEGVKGRKAVDWRLVDAAVPLSRFDEAVAERAAALATRSDRPGGEGVTLGPLEREIGADGVTYSAVAVAIDRAARIATVTVRAPGADDDPKARSDRLWALRMAREFDEALLHLRANEPETGVLLFRAEGDPAGVLAHEAALDPADWFANEVIQNWKRVMKRLDMTARTTVALVEPGSCFAGMLAEIAFAADRAYMAEGEFEDDDRPEATLTLTDGNFGAFPMANGLPRLATRFLGDDAALDAARARSGEALTAEEARDLGLVTFVYDDIDWEDEVRIFLEERAGFSPDAMTAMEANLRFPGPETMETRIFGRLTAWQNWIFQRPNATGAEGALRRYGTGKRADFDRERV